VYTPASVSKLLSDFAAELPLVLLFLKSVTSITLLEVFSEEQLQQIKQQEQQEQQQQEPTTVGEDLTEIDKKIIVANSSSGNGSGGGGGGEWYDDGSSRVHVLASCEVQQPLSDAVAEQRALFLRAAAADPEEEVKGCYSLNLVWR
jgi:hypothetical protein